MSELLRVLRAHAQRQPLACAINDLAGAVLSWRELLQTVERRVRAFHGVGVSVLGIHCDNGVEWVVSDLAAHVAGIPTVPLPTFFSDPQLAHVCKVAGVDAVVSDEPERLGGVGFDPGAALDHGDTWMLSGAPPDSGTPAPFQKITFTSGTTGTPKGVCLAQEHLELVASTLAVATGSLSSDVHVCCLPLSILLENLAGVYRSLLTGGTLVVPSLARIGLQGAQQYDPNRALATIRECGATSAILVPEMLQGLAFAARDGARTQLRYIGVGGARVSPALLERANAVGLPAYEGYGLSEFASVVAMNTPGDVQLGASGRPLSHLRVRIADTGEIEVLGPHFQGYLTEQGLTAPETTEDGYLRTGDRGALGSDGFLRVTGRLRNVLITSFGRNVSPEWIESELLSHPAVAQAVVFGDGAPALEAVVVARGPDETVREHVAAVNAALPDYARIARCVVAGRALSEIPGLTHPSGSPRRDAVAERYAATAPLPHPPTEYTAWDFTTAS